MPNYDQEIQDYLIFVFGDGSVNEPKVVQPDITEPITDRLHNSIDSLLDDYIDNMTLYEIFGDVVYKVKAEQILVNLKR